MCISTCTSVNIFARVSRGTPRCTRTRVPHTPAYPPPSIRYQLPLADLRRIRLPQACTAIVSAPTSLARAPWWTNSARHYCLLLVSLMAIFRDRHPAHTLPHSRRTHTHTNTDANTHTHPLPFLFLPLADFSARSRVYSIMVRPDHAGWLTEGHNDVEFTSACPTRHVTASEQTN